MNSIKPPQDKTESTAFSSSPSFFGRVLCAVGIHTYSKKEEAEDMALLECERCGYPKVIKVRC